MPTVHYVGFPPCLHKHKDYLHKHVYLHTFIYIHVYLHKHKDYFHKHVYSTKIEHITGVKGLGNLKLSSERNAFVFGLLIFKVWEVFKTNWGRYRARISLRSGRTLERSVSLKSLVDSERNLPNFVACSFLQNVLRDAS